MESARIAQLIAEAAQDKKARDVATVDLQGKTLIADYFVICEGDTDRQVRAISENIEDRLREHGVRPLATAGRREGTWVCLDYDSVIAHIFLPGERTFYDLEGLWNAVAKTRQAADEPA